MYISVHFAHKVVELYKSFSDGCPLYYKLYIVGLIVLKKGTVMKVGTFS
jgi:hypothetical protein